MKTLMNVHSIATVALGGTLGDKVAAAAAAGFAGIELFEPDLIASPLAPEEIRRRLADLGLTLELYQPLRDIEGNPPDVFERRLRLARAKFALMERLGARMALICSNVSPLALNDDDLAAGQLAEVASAAREHGVTIAYEALAWGTHVSEYPRSWRIVERAGHPALGVCLDSFHILARGTGLEEIADIPAEKLFMLQLADAPRMRMDELQWSRHHRCFPGQGAFDLADFLRRVLATGYDGPLSLEVFNDVFRQADPFRTAADGRRSLLWLEDQVARGPRIPEPEEPRGFAFIEFRAPAGDTPALDRLLSGLGFTRTGEHRTKPVGLWEAGDARILLNAGDDHCAGPPRFEVTSVGLDVRDAESAARRALALRAPLMPRHHKRDEADFTGVRAPDGIEIFFCGQQEGTWRDDFDPVPVASSPRPKSGIAGIDHLSLTQPLTLVHETVLFYRSVLRLAPLAAQELPSPYGLIRSQGLAARDLRFVINVPALGGGRDGFRAVQEAAIRSDDIVVTARTAAAQGLSVLPIPANYYEDLRARHGLSENLAETYQRYNIAYDEDGAGHAFRHFWVTVPGTSVLFEIVDREPGYAGYGAVNATVRMTAQEGR